MVIVGLSRAICAFDISLDAWEWLACDRDLTDSSCKRLRSGYKACANVRASSIVKLVKCDEMDARMIFFPREEKTRAGYNAKGRDT